MLLPLWLILLARVFGLRFDSGPLRLRWDPPSLGLHGRADPPLAFAFVVPGSAIFLLAALVKFAPWAWDNTKIMIWAYFLVLPFLWTELIARWSFPLRAGVCLALFGSGFVSLMGGLAAGRPGFELISRSYYAGVGQALERLPVEERFAAHPTFDHPVLLHGRKMVLGYPGHLWTQGFKYDVTSEKLRALMMGAPNWQELARELNVRYLFWGREEKKHYPGSTRPWERLTGRVDRGDWGAIYDLHATIPDAGRVPPPPPSSTTPPP